MIRKFGRLDAPRDEVARLFGDLESWPQWMPGLKRLRVTSRGERTLRVHVTQAFMGQEFRQELEARPGASGVALRQIAGSFRRWESTWRFLTPPDGRGTTVALELDFDLGLLGWFSPSGLVQSALDRLFAQVLDRAGGRLAAPRAAAPAPARPAAVSRLASPPTTPGPVAVTPSGAEGDVLLQVFQTPAGLEVWVSGRRFEVPSAHR